MFIFVGIITLILSLVHFVVYKYTVSIFGMISLKWIITTRAIFVLLALSFVTASIFAYSYNNLVTRIFYRLSAAWLGLLLYLFLVSVLYGLILILTSYLGTNFSVSVVGKILFGVSLIIWVYGLFHAESIQIKSVDINIPNLPVEWKNKKAIWVSDIHLGQVHGEAFSQKVVDKIKAQNPDIVFLGGDIFDGVKVGEDTVLAPFSTLRPPLGIFFITGNHEEFSDNKHFVDAVKRVGVKVLENEMLNVDGIQLIGVFDRNSDNKTAFSSILSSLKIDKNIPSILLKHQPKDIDVSNQYGISFQISGHTHRAQMFPLSIVPYFVYKGFDYGLHSLGSTQVFTSSGVGTWGPPVRVGTDSEIVEFTFK